MQANGPGGGGFKRAEVDEFLGGALCRWPGVRPLTVRDSPQAAEHIAGLTRALAEQPFRVEVGLPAAQVLLSGMLFSCERYVAGT